MPYIKPVDRLYINKKLVSNKKHINYSQIATPGELNFAISTMINDYLQTTGVCYGSINTLIGVLECAKLELYRRIASPYEDEKIKENGDVYE